MKRTSLNGPFYHESHKRPVSRRELLGQGFLTASSSVMMPSLLSMLFQRQAFAQQDLRCPGGSQAGTKQASVPFLVLDLAGGGNLVGSEVLVGKAGGLEDALACYDTLGLPAAMAPGRVAGDKQFGLVFHPDAAILRGLTQVVTDPAIRAKVDGMVFCAASDDDTANNPHNPMHWIAKAGALGQLAALVGSNPTPSGGRARAPATSIDPAQTPVTIRRPADVLGLVNPGKIARLLADDKAMAKILAATRSMSAAQLAMFQEKDMPAQLRTLVECGYLASGDLVSKYGPAQLDPTLDTAVSTAFNLTDAVEGQIGSIAKLLLDGYAGAGTVSVPGFDYHTGNRATGERKNADVGRYIGKAINLAAAKQEDLMIYVYTDGGVVANAAVDSSTDGRGKNSWAGDSGERSGAFALVYRHAGKMEIRNNQRQIGAYKDSGTVDREATKISGSPETLTKAVVANYLALHGKEDELAKVVGDDPFGAELDKYLAFTKIR